MSIKVTYNLKNTLAVLDRTRNLSSIMKSFSMDIIENMKSKHWLRGFGGDGTRLRKYSPRYAAYKKKVVGSDKVSLALFGDMQDAYYAKKEKATDKVVQYALTFRNSKEMTKASGNHAMRSNMMRIDKKIVQPIANALKNFIFYHKYSDPI